MTIKHVAVSAALAIFAGKMISGSGPAQADQIILSVARRRLGVLFAVCVALALGTTTASAGAVAQGFDCPKVQGKLICQRCDSYSYIPALCIEWTGSYPTGYVRAGPGSWLWYSLKLQVCESPGRVNGNCFVDDGVVYGQPYTPWKKVGKYGWYRSCFQVIRGGKWNCQNPGDYEYLGD
jgi:hypothetical protein